MAAYVLSAGRATPKKTALTIMGDVPEHWTYARLTAAVLGTATGLLAAGLSPGERLMLRLGNTADFPITYLGAIAAGIVPVPTAAGLTTGEVTKLAMQCAPAAIAAAPDVALPEGPWPQLDLARLRGFHTLAPHVPEMGDPNRPAYIVFTSGTSGRPRGVVHAHRAIWARRMMWDGWYGLTADDRLMHAGAFNWTYTLGTGLMDPWAIGATALIPQAGTAPADLPALMAEHACTIFAAAPGVYRQLLRQSFPPLPALRHGLSAGEKLSEGLRDAWQRRTSTDIHEAFGMSECSTFLSGSPTYPAPNGTLGHPQPGRDITVKDGVLGIHHSDPGLMLGYLDDPAGTQARFDGDYFMTGDLVEPEGDALRYIGRADDMMNAGGFRVSPLEIEAALTLHPSVSEAAATQVQLDADTTLIAAFYTGDATAEDILKAHCAKHLAFFKRPHAIIRLDTLPRGANNKLLRRSLRDDWEKNHGQT